MDSELLITFDSMSGLDVATSVSGGIVGIRDEQAVELGMDGQELASSIGPLHLASRKEAGSPEGKKPIWLGIRTHLLPQWHSSRYA